MANTFTPAFDEVLSREMQKQFLAANVARAIADMSFQGEMSKGDVLRRPYRSLGARAPQSYDRSSNITLRDLTVTDEQLSVNGSWADGFYVDKHDKIQSQYDLAVKFGQDYGTLFSNKIDADILGEAVNATSTVDAGDVGGSAGSPIALTTSNVLQAVSAAKKKLRKQNVPMERLFGVVSPEFEDVLIRYGAGRDTNLADEFQKRGMITNFYGFDLYSSNLLSNTAVLGLATNPTNGDTVVINGVTFTFVSSIGTTAGNVLIAGSADATRANLATLINAPSTTTANGVALAAADSQEFIAYVSATNDNTANTLTVQYKGIGALAVSETLTDATDAWTSVVQNCLFGVYGAPTVVVQSEPTVMLTQPEAKLGKNTLLDMLYGYKTFADNAKMMVNVKVDASGF